MSEDPFAPPPGFPAPSQPLAPGGGFQPLPPPPGWGQVNDPNVPARRRKWPWLLGGCCLLPVVAFLALFVWGMVVVMRSGFGIPSDFPRYPGATQTGFHTYGNSDSERSGTDTDISYHSGDPASRVEDFYTARLSGPPWHVTSRDPACRCIDFSNAEGTIQGHIEIEDRGTGSAFRVRFRR